MEISKYMANYNLGQLAAVGQMALAIVSSMGYAYVGNWRQAIYWGAAAVITGSVTL